MSLKEGEIAPDFRLQDTEGEYVELYDRLGRGQQVVLLFFPLAFSSTCREELCTVRDNKKMYDSLNADIIGISIDSFFTLREFKKALNLNMTLLSDFNREASSRYDVLYDDFYGLKGVTKRAAFIVGEDKKIRYAEVMDDADNLPDFDVIVEKLA